MYRSYLALRKFGVVRDGIRDDNSVLKPWKTLANYLQVIVQKSTLQPFTLLGLESLFER